jgi:alanine racemase
MGKQFLCPSFIELDRSALENNLKFLRSNASNGLRISCVIKGNAYGHGISNYLPVAESCGIDHFSVFSADEAAAAFKYKEKSSTGIMIMGMIRNDELRWAIEHGVEFYLFERDRLDSAIEAAADIGKKARIHLQIETGMNRTGFEEDQWHEVF